MRRNVLAGLAAASVVGITVATSAFAAPSDEHLAAGRNAAHWMFGQLEDGLLVADVFGQKIPDIGLTIDTLLGMKATGADAASVRTVADAVATKAEAWAIADVPVDIDGDGTPEEIVHTVDAGSVSKLLFAAVATGRDPKAFGGLDLDDLTRGLIATEGPHAGRVRDVNPEAWGGDGSNVFDQSLAVLGLVGTGGVPDAVVGYLIKQQCPSGGFRLNPATDGSACADNGQADVDATAMAVQALIAAGSGNATTAAGKGGDWLAGLQGADGSFGNGSQTPIEGVPVVFNTNSTGLGGQALAATGHADEANEAAAWVAALQVTSGPEAGAIAYSQSEFDAGAPDDNSRGTWWRSTPQALLGLVQVPLGEIAEVPAGEPSSPGSSSSSSSASSSASASASASASSSSASTTPTATATTTAPTTSGGSLPTTGEPVLQFALYALGLIGAGVILLIAARRRRLSA